MRGELMTRCQTYLRSMRANKMTARQHISHRGSTQCGAPLLPFSAVTSFRLRLVTLSLRAIGDNFVIVIAIIGPTRYEPIDSSISIPKQFPV